MIDQDPPSLTRAMREYAVDGVIAIDTMTHLVAQGYSLEFVEELCARQSTIGND